MFHIKFISRLQIEFSSENTSNNYDSNDSFPVDQSIQSLFDDLIGGNTNDYLDPYNANTERIRQAKEKEEERQIKINKMLVMRIRQKRAKMSQDQIQDIENGIKKRWNKNDSREFEIIVACLGIQTCKPHQIMKRQRGYHGIAKTQTHLQKYRQQTKQSNGLQSANSIKNWMYRTESKNRAILKEICHRWRDPNFAGYTDTEINYYLNKHTDEEERYQQNKINLNK